MGALDQTAVLERALASLRWSGATVEPLRGGITNANFRVRLGADVYFLRIPAGETTLLGIDRDVERAAAEAAAACGIGPPVVASLPDLGCLVTRYIDGRTLEDADIRGPYLPAVVELVRTFHEGAALPGRFSPFRITEAYRETAAARGVDLPSDYYACAALVGEIEWALPAVIERPCHNDLLPGNFLDGGQRLWLADYEYAGMGDPFFDLGNLSVNNGFDDPAEERLLDLYFSTVTRQHRARLKLMRIVSDFREAMWGVVQQAVSTLDFDYRGYAERHFARCLLHAQDPRYRGWLDEVGA